MALQNCSGLKVPFSHSASGVSSVSKLCQTRRGREGSGFLLAAGQVGAGLECWGCWSITDLLLPPNRAAEPSALWSHSPNPPDSIPEQGLWSCSCGSAGGSVCGWGLLGTVGTAQSRALRDAAAQAGLLWAHQWLLLKHTGTWQLPAAGGTLKDRQDKGEWSQATGRAGIAVSLVTAPMAAGSPCSSGGWRLPRALGIAGSLQGWWDGSDSQCHVNRTALEWQSRIWCSLG